MYDLTFWKHKFYNKMDKLFNVDDDDDDDELHRQVMEEMEEMAIDDISVESWRTPQEASFHSDDYSITNQYLANNTEDMDLPELDNHFFFENSKMDGMFDDVKTLETGSCIFVKDRTYAWLPAKVISTNATHAVVSISKPKVNSEDPKEFFKPFPQNEKQEEIINSQQYMSSNIISFQNLKVGAEYDELTPLHCMASNSDLKDMIHINEASVLYNFKIRHGLKMPYVRIGKLMMVAMNPLAVSTLNFFLYFFIECICSNASKLFLLQTFFNIVL